MNTSAIIWFRKDLRLSDNPALAAVQGPVLPVYIYDETAPPMGGASRWWLHYSLAALNESLGGRLILRRGDPLEIMPALMRETGAENLYLNRCYEPHAVRRDSTLKSMLEAEGKNYFSYKANLLFEPWEIKNQQGKPYGVFTPFWKACREKEIDSPLSTPEHISFACGMESDHLADWDLLPTHPDWAGGLRAAWQVGEAAAQVRLKEFLKAGLQGYAEGRDIPAKSNVSRLSPHLHFGEISPRQILRAAGAAVAANAALLRDAEKFKAEIGWREFSYSLLFHHPNLPAQPLQGKFKDFPWQKNQQYLRAWQRGQTGYPIVDAGMRELWETGYMHNRVRMIAASFLVKNLLQPWQDGEAWFWDTLVDADLANNSASWQWVAGCGADAAPYFRVFNPVLQGEKFDPQGEYVRRWVPELAGVPDRLIHRPWELPTPPRGYPAPIVGLMFSRDRALEAYKMLQETGDPS